MSDQARAMQSADDAELLNMVRAGDSAAFQVLRQRHEHAARRLARDLVVTVSDVEDVVAETFTRLLEATQLGGGPSDAFRPYLLTALRQVCDESAGAARQVPATGSESLAEAGESASDSLIARAFLPLPERWIAVLWHAEIEGSGPAEIAPLLGLSPGAVAALRRRAKDGLSRAYLQIYTSELARPECGAAAIRLGAFIRDAVSGPDSAMVTEHLSQCDDCRTVFAELSDVSMPLRAMVAPVFLGDSAGYYLSESTRGARTHVVPAPLAATAGVAAAASVRTAGRSGTVRHSGRQLRWIAAGGATAIAAGAVVFAFSLTGNSTPLTPGSGSQAETSPPTAAAFAKPSATGARSASGRVVGPDSASRAHSTPAIPPSSPQRSPDRPSRRPGGSPSPTPSPTPSAALVQLAASVNVYSGHQWQGAMAVFQVSDTGSAKTGTLTVSVVLPPGSWLISWGHGHGHDGNQGGWSCQATSSGASCTHNPVQAGSQSQGTIFIGIGGSSACGQPVSVTATSGSATASAQSTQVLAC